MIICLYLLGHDEQTRVTYMFDDDHVWLETVHDVEDDEGVRKPRVVERLTPDLKDSEWISREGYRYSWNGFDMTFPWDRPHVRGRSWEHWQGDASAGPYTEVVE